MGAKNRTRLSRTGWRVTTGPGTTRHRQTGSPRVLDLIKASLRVTEHACCLTSEVSKTERRHSFGESVFMERGAMNPPLSARQRLKSAVGIVKTTVIDRDPIGIRPIDPGARRTADSAQSS